MVSANEQNGSLPAMPNRIDAKDPTMFLDAASITMPGSVDFSEPRVTGDGM